MARIRPEGTCHICGDYTVLSFEHVPPRRAFNDHPIRYLEGEEGILRDPTKPVTGGTIAQKGAGAYTLCHSCNNKTGSWYGPAFIDWTIRGYEILEATGGRPSLIYMYDARPLRIVKMIATMFCSMNEPDLVERLGLRRFVLNPEATGMDPRVRVFAFYCPGTVGRRTGLMARGNWDRGLVPTSVYSEIAFPPIGYVLTVGRSEPPDERLRDADISWFAHEPRRTVSMNLPVLPVVSGLPGDYRTVRELEATRRENQALQAERANGRRGDGGRS